MTMSQTAGIVCLHIGWDIGKVFQRLIVDVCNETGAEPVPALVEVYNSWITDSMENYNSSMYYENPGYLFASYKWPSTVNFFQNALQYKVFFIENTFMPFLFL